jgi:hypothetical protein
MKSDIFDPANIAIVFAMAAAIILTGWGSFPSGDNAARPGQLSRTYAGQSHQVLEAKRLPAFPAK